MSSESKVYERDQVAKASWLLFFSVILIGATLRAPLTSVGSVISFIREDLQMTYALAGTITTLPLLAFAFFSPIVPKIAQRLGLNSSITICLLSLTAGIFVRSMPGMFFLFLGTLLIGLAIAIGNVLLPAFVKVNFPLRIGLMTGFYSVAMNLFGGLASGLSVPISRWNNIGWQGALAFWGIITLIAVILWIPQMRKKGPLLQSRERKGNARLWRSALAWQVTMFMGLQSLMFYTFVAWLPEILQSTGYRSDTAGWMLSLLQFSVIPFTFIVPIIAERMKSQSLLGAITGTLYLLGIGGLLLQIDWLVPISVILYGIAGGFAFGLAMMFFTLRTSDGQQAAELSGMAQSVGYLLASLGPLIFGGLQDLTQNWTVSLLMLIIIGIAIFFFGIGAGRDKLVTDD